jgi:hypothetical protein
MSIETRFAKALDHLFEGIFAAPAVESYARSGSYLLRLCFADRALAAEFLPSFLRDSAGRADLQVGFLSSGQCDLSHLVPDPPTEYRTIAFKGWFAVWQPGELPMLYLMDRRSQRAIVWLAARAAPDWIASRPTLPIMYALSVDTPWITVHAAAVGRENRTLLLIGEGRTGKTTAALACAAAGWDYAGDDYVYANTADGRIEPLYCSARLRDDMAWRFPSFVGNAAGVSVSNGEQRHELRLTAQLGPERIKGGLLAAMLLPRRGGAALPIFSRARRWDAVSALYTSMTLTQLGWAAVMVKKVTATVALAPVFFVDTGQHPEKIPDAFSEFMDRL